MIRSLLSTATSLVKSPLPPPPSCFGGVSPTDSFSSLASNFLTTPKMLSKPVVLYWKTKIHIIFQCLAELSDYYSIANRIKTKCLNLPSHLTATALPDITADHFPALCSRSPPPPTTCHFPNKPCFLQILPLDTLSLRSVPGRLSFLRLQNPPYHPEAELVASFSGSHRTLYVVLDSAV